MGIFIGRENELAKLSQTQSSLVPSLTVLGPGGVGKTRLVREWLAATETRALWLDVSALSSAQAVFTRLAEVLRTKDRHAESIAEELSNKKWSVVVFDNCEFIPSAVANVVQQLRDLQVPSLQLALSREVLGFPGERLLRVEPLGAGAIELLSETMSQRGVPFDPTEDAQGLREVARLLQGLPLAIELAAARAETVSFKNLLHELLEGHASLRNDQPGETARHQSLEACFEISFRACNQDELEALARLSYCAAEGFDLECATAMLGPRASITIESLVRKSLLFSRRQESGSFRFGMYIGIRELSQQALEKLGLRESTARLHLHHFAKVVALPLNGVSSISNILRLRNVVESFRDNLEIARRCECRSSEDWSAKVVLLDGFRAYGFAIGFEMDLLNDLQLAVSHVSKSTDAKMPLVFETLLHTAHATSLSQLGRNNEALEVSRLAIEANRQRALEERVGGTIVSTDPLSVYARKRAHLALHIQATVLFRTGDANAVGRAHAAVKEALESNFPESAINMLCILLVNAADIGLESNELDAIFDQIQSLSRSYSIDLSDFFYYETAAGWVRSEHGDYQGAARHFAAGRDATAVFGIPSTPWLFMNFQWLRARLVFEPMSPGLLSDFESCVALATERRDVFLADLRMGFAFASALAGQRDVALGQFWVIDQGTQAPSETAIRHAFEAVLSEISNRATGSSALQKALALKNVLGPTTEALVDAVAEWFVDRDRDRLIANLQKPPASRLLESRLFVRLLENIEQPAALHSIVVAPDGAWFRINGRPPEALLRAQPRQILVAIVHAANAKQDGPSAEDLARILWPDEDPTNPKVKNRVHVAMTAVRNSDLREFVHAKDGRYCFRSDVAVQFAALEVDA